MNNNLHNDFVPYQPSLDLEELGFNEPCFGCYFHNNENVVEYNPDGIPFNHNNRNSRISAPTFSQAFRFFREKHNCVCEIIRKEVGNHSEFIGWVYIDDRKIDVVSYWDSKSYEEAELACLLKLIEIVKTK